MDNPRLDHDKPARPASAAYDLVCCSGVRTAVLRAVGSPPPAYILTHQTVPVRKAKMGGDDLRSSGRSYPPLCCHDGRSHTTELVFSRRNGERAYNRAGNE